MAGARVNNFTYLSYAARKKDKLDGGYIKTPPLYGREHWNPKHVHGDSASSLSERWVHNKTILFRQTLVTRGKRILLTEYTQCEILESTSRENAEVAFS